VEPGLGWLPLGTNQASQESWVKSPWTRKTCPFIVYPLKIIDELERRATRITRLLRRQ
jgi:hypothetical protein